MNFNKIVHQERKQLSPEITVLWIWFDRSDELPGWRHGDENFPYCGTYQNRKLVATVYWNPASVNLKTVTHFLNTNPDYVKIPYQSVVNVPREI